MINIQFVTPEGVFSYRLFPDSVQQLHVTVTCNIRTVSMEEMPSEHMTSYGKAKRNTSFFIFIYIYFYKTIYVL